MATAGLVGQHGSSAIANHAAVAELRRGCEELKKPLELATELVQFLQLRRLHGSDISPGFVVDELWHWMLLNTKVANAVHELLGGQVHHSTARTLNEVELGFRRAKAFSLLHRNGCSPHLEFWQEPGTFLHSIKEYKLQVMGSEPVSVFASSLSSEADIIRLANQVWAYPVEQLTLLHSGGEPGGVSPSPSRAAGKLKRKQGLSAGSAPPKKRQAANGLAPDTSNDPGQAAHHSKTRPSLQISLCSVGDSLNIDFRVRPYTRFSNMFSVYAQKVGCHIDELRFMHDGMHVWKDDTPATHGMEDGDKIDVLVAHKGC